MRKLNIFLFAAAVCLLCAHQSMAAVANITEYKAEFLKALNSEEYSCEDRSFGTHLTKEPDYANCIRDTSRGLYDCFRISTCKCKSKRAVEVKTKTSIDCYCEDFPLTSCTEDVGATCTPCGDNDKIAPKKRFVKTCDLEGNFVEIKNKDGDVTGCRCDSAGHFVLSGNKCVCDSADGWKLQNGVCVPKDCPNGYAIDMSDCNPTYDTLTTHPSAKSGGQKCQKCLYCSKEGLKLTNGGLSCECDTSAGYKYNDGYLPVCVCDTANGWVADSSGCGGADCDGSTNPDCGDGYSKVATGCLSGGKMTYTCELNEAECDSSKGWMQNADKTDCVADGCDSGTTDAATLNACANGTETTGDMSGGVACKKCVETTRPTCDASQGWKLNSAGTSCVADGCDSGTTDVATLNACANGTETTDDMSGGVACKKCVETIRPTCDTSQGWMLNSTGTDCVADGCDSGTTDTATLNACANGTETTGDMSGGVACKKCKAAPACDCTGYGLKDDVKPQAWEDWEECPCNSAYVKVNGCAESGPQYEEENGRCKIVTCKYDGNCETWCEYNCEAYLTGGDNPPFQCEGSASGCNFIVGDCSTCFK